MHKSHLIGIIIGCIVYFSLLLFFKKPDAVIPPNEHKVCVSQLLHHHLLPHINLTVYFLSFCSSTLKHVKAAILVKPKSQLSASPLPSLSNPLSYDQHTGSGEKQHQQQQLRKETFDKNYMKPAPTTPVTPVQKTSRSTADCMQLKTEHKVHPGKSWGSLSEHQQKIWTALECDRLVAEVAAASPSSRSGTSATTKALHKRKPEPDVEAVTAADVANMDLTGMPVISRENIVWCSEKKNEFKVRPMQSWGKLPEAMITQWKSKGCDLVFTAHRMGSRPVAECKSTSSSSDPSSHSNMKDSLPRISVMAATTTRKIDNPSTTNLALFTYLLPSLIRSIDCGFRYEFVLGYDMGDPYYDSVAGNAEVKKWFTDNIQDPMAKKGIELTLRMVKVNNSLKKPGPVFVEMARAAYNGGAEFMYRVNDDTEMTENWPAEFVRGVLSMGKPYGVVGPQCDQGKTSILTHDFVNRMHMEVFEMNYYPPELTDWWMDDWISLVYGKQRTFKAKNVPVIHHTGAHGQRYAVDMAHEKLLVQLVESGRKKIRNWMLKNGVAEKDIKTFDADTFKHGFKHLDIPPPK